MLKQTFVNFGIPDTVVSDNATCFMSRETQDFFKKYGIKHCTGAPYNPITNGLAERAVRIFKENFKKFDVKLPMNLRIFKFLYSYRRAVQSSTGCSPAELMFGRKFKGPLDMIMPKQRDNSISDCMESKFKVGDAVYARNFGRGPEWVEAKITKVLGRRNYLVSVNVNGTLIWKRHLNQLFARKLYNSMETCEALPNVSVPIMPHIPVSSPSSVGTDSRVVNVPSDCINIESGSSNPVQPVVKDITKSQCRPSVVLRRSTRTVKKPDRLMKR